MSDLSENLSQWPRDPYKLLGVGHDDDERTVRKAYLRLVRRFKPDFHPEHFQRIREAFDSITNRLMYYRDFAEPDSVESYPTQTQQLDERVSLTATAPLAEAWREATEGREQDAYRKLLRMVRRGEWVADACLRLYWLQFAAPNLDASIEPCHWLVVGLVETRLTGPMFDLYSDEIMANPHEATTDRCTSLLEVDCEQGRLYDLLQIRWRACDQLADYARITNDLAMLKERFGYHDEVMWLRLMLLAARHLAWGDEHALRHFRYLTELITQSRFHDHEIDFELDRIDLLVEIVEQRNALRFLLDVPPTYMELVERSWVQTYEEYQPALASVVAMIARNPTRAMKHFDHLKRANQAAASHLVDLIRSHSHVSFYADADMSDRARGASKRFLYQLKKADYGSARAALLQTSLDEAIDPVYLAQFADQGLADPHAQGWWTSSASSDIAMQGVYCACRSVWG